MPVETCLSKTLGCLNILSTSVIKSSGVLEHAQEDGSRTRLAELSSCKIVRFECSCCFCSCLWALVSMPPCIHVTHESFFLSAWCVCISDCCQVFFFCILPVFCLFNEFLWERAPNIETLVHYSLFGTVLCLKGKFIRKDHFRRAVGINVTHQLHICTKPPGIFKTS